MIVLFIIFLLQFTLLHLNIFLFYFFYFCFFFFAQYHPFSILLFTYSSALFFFLNCQQNKYDVFFLFIILLYLLLYSLSLYIYIYIYACVGLIVSWRKCSRNRICICDYCVWFVYSTCTLICSLFFT